jgi:hypothetical protein
MVAPNSAVDNEVSTVDVGRRSNLKESLNRGFHRSREVWTERTDFSFPSGTAEVPC